MAAVDSTFTFNAETITNVRDTLLIGLAAYGELERLSVVQEIQAKCGESIREDLRVIHPTGASDTISRFAEALRMLC